MSQPKTAKQSILNRGRDPGSESDAKPSAKQLRADDSKQDPIPLVSTPTIPEVKAECKDKYYSILLVVLYDTESGKLIRGAKLKYTSSYHETAANAENFVATNSIKDIEQELGLNGPILVNLQSRFGYGCAGQTAKQQITLLSSTRFDEFPKNIGLCLFTTFKIDSTGFMTRIDM